MCKTSCNFAILVVTYSCIKFHFIFCLDADQPVPLELPDQWLWELVDEFVYQFQSFAQFRARVQKKTPEELEKLQTQSKVWNVLCVLNVLHSLVDKSKIKRQLEVSFCEFSNMLRVEMSISIKRVLFCGCWSVLCLRVKALKNCVWFQGFDNVWRYTTMLPIHLHVVLIHGSYFLFIYIDVFYVTGIFIVTSSKDNFAGHFVQRCVIFCFRCMLVVVILTLWQEILDDTLCTRCLVTSVWWDF